MSQYHRLHDAERLDVILIPLYEGAIFHGGITNGHCFDERATRQDKAADMLG